MATKNGRKIYKTMRGKVVDMDLLQQRNELTPAVGNARVNARGDELGAGGKIIRKKEDLMKEYYENSNRVPDEPMTRTVTKPTVKEPDSTVKTNKTTRAQKKVAEGIAEDPKMADEFGDNEEWVEDENGNFIPKSEA
jgi:hypothetical protein